VFQDNIHVLDWLRCGRSYGQPRHFVMQRLNRLEEELRQQINKLALYTPPRDLDELLEPLQVHYAASWSPVRHLEELRIILDIPTITESAARYSRIREENQVCRTASCLRYVDKVIIQNIYYRDRSDFRLPSLGRTWSVLAWEDDDPRLNDDRFELAITTFPQ
jgi:hypothetical protein